MDASVTFTFYCGVIKDETVEYLPLGEICDHNRQATKGDFWAVVSIGVSPEEAKRNYDTSANL